MTIDHEAAKRLAKEWKDVHAFSVKTLLRRDGYGLVADVFEEGLKISDAYLDLAAQFADSREAIRSLTTAVADLTERLEAAKKDAERYRRLRLLGCAPSTSPKHLDNGLVLRFTNLDAHLDNDIRIYPSRGDATMKKEGV